MSKLVDLTGKRFGRWTVLKLAVGGSHAKWLCKCECGAIREINTQAIRRGGTKSCGCLKRELARDRQTTHGHSNVNSGTYNSWLSMRRRCLDPKEKAYKYYGGRGIKISPSWINSFETFLADMGEKPPKLTLERKDTNGDYEPSNCYWASRKIQSRNKRTTKLNLHDAINIIKLRIKGLTYRKIGEKYNIGESHVAYICKGNLWPEALEITKRSKYE